MSLTITYLGHSGFLLSDGRWTLAIDPFLTGNPVAVHTPEQISCTHVALTHGHADHMGDTVTIAKANKATCIAAYEIAGYLGEQGVEKTEPGNPGGRIETPFGWIAFSQAFHSSSYEGRYMGMPCGLIVEMGGVVFYHAGDTGIFSDMALIGEIYKPRVAALPIGDRFTMGPELATRAAEMIKPETAIPVHFRTFPPLVQNAQLFRPSGVEVREMQPGESWKVS